MLFSNPIMLAGLAVALIPVILHLLTQHRAKRLQWGAMQFLMASVARRSRKMLIEQILLLVIRCLLLALLAMAMALPFVPPESRVPWQFVLPAVLLGVALLGAAAALGAYRAWRWTLIAAGSLMIAFAVAVTVAERSSQTALLPQASGGSDIAIVIDGSSSMRLVVDGRSNFDHAIEEAQAVVTALDSGDAATIIVAGADPHIEVPSPQSHSDRLSKIIEQLQPVGGTMSISPTLAAAVTTLDRGDNVSKTIVLITDGQSAGWSEDGQVNWELMRAAIGDSQTPPALLVRKLDMPERVKNLQVVSVAIPDGVISPDRDVPINVLIENTGGQSIRKAVDVELRIDGSKQVLRRTIRDVDSGVSETVTFRHRFAHGGLHSLSAKIVIEDDLPWDNHAERVVSVFERLPVLLVNGNPTRRWRDRATSFLEVSLAPDFDGSTSKESSSALFSITTVDAPQIASVSSFSDFRVVILADVAKLPANTAFELAQFVADGGGLLVAPGSRCDPVFYHAWKTAKGRALMPALLGKRVVRADGDAGFHPMVSTFQHPALKLIVENPDTDMGAASLTTVWRLKCDKGDDTVQVCGKLDTGEPFVVERQVGEGRVLVTAVSLDNRDGNLPALQSFLPFVREMVGHVMQLPQHGLERDSIGAESFVLPLGFARRRITGENLPDASGLWAEYYSDPRFGRRMLARVDPNVSFNWGASPAAAGMPTTGFSIRWSGTLTPSATSTYRFFVDGSQTNAWLDGKLIATTSAKGDALEGIELIEGHPYALRVEYVDGTKEKQCRLLWESSTSKREPIQTENLSPREAWKVQLAGQVAQTSGSKKKLRTTLVAPDGTRHAAVLRSVAERVHVSFQRLAEPGLYRLELPDSFRDIFRDTLPEQTVPLVVRSSPQESHLEVLSEEQFRAGREHLPLVAVSSLDSLLMAISGDMPGYRFWKLLVVAALFLIVAEIALARWIAVQRRLGSTSHTKRTDSLQSPPVSQTSWPRATAPDGGVKVGANSP